jgi:glycosyltransferase involved in cell wall biosynthesis
VLTVHQMFTRGSDAVRRLSQALPEPAYQWLRGIASWSDRRPPPPLQDWSRPLIPTAAGPHRLGLADTTPVVPAVEATGAAVPAPPEPPGLRCLIATSRLDVGGLEEMVTFLALRLPAQHVQTAVLHAVSAPPPAGELSGRLARMLSDRGIQVVEADEAGTAGWVEQWRPDVISAHGAPKWVFDAAQRLGVPYVDNLHGMYRLFGGDWQWHAEAAHGTSLAAVVAVSELVRQQYLADNPAFPPGGIVTIPNGVNDERRVSGNRAAVRGQLGLADEYLFVSLARYSLQKNTYGLLSAFAELAGRCPEAHLVVAGRPDDLRYYRRILSLRDNMPGRDRVHLRDHLATPAQLLSAADGFVLDSFFEGWSLASMEALHAGVPVVLSDVGGAREQIGDDPRRGILVSNPLGDPLSVDWESVAAARFRAQPNRDELVTAMARLVADRERYLGDRAALAAESAARFSAGECLRQHAGLLRTAASGVRR